MKALRALICVCTHTHIYVYIYIYLYVFIYINKFMFIWILPKYVVCVWVHTHIQELNMDFMQWPMKFFSTQKLSKIECQNIKKKIVNNRQTLVLLEVWRFRFHITNLELTEDNRSVVIIMQIYIPWIYLLHRGSNVIE